MVIMNSNEGDCLLGLDRLMKEFASASTDESRIRHQRISGLPNQSLNSQTWEDLQIANRSVIKQQTNCQWEKWVSHGDGLVCSRFVGGAKFSFELFQKLANTGMALLREASLNSESNLNIQSGIADIIESRPTPETYLYWLELLHLTAKECRTVCLHVDIGNWNHEASPYESVQQVAKAMSEPTAFGIGAFPLHPIVEELQHDVFRSSVEAIKVWLGAEDVTRVGQWHNRPLLYLRSLNKESSEPSGVIASTQQVAQPEEIVEESSPPDPTKLVIDDKSGIVSYGGVSKPWPDVIAYSILKSLKKHNQHGAVIEDIRLDAWGAISVISDEFVEKQISNLRTKLKEKGYTGITIPRKPVGGRYKLILTYPTISE
jgi:hypothetical protein